MRQGFGPTSAPGDARDYSFPNGPQTPEHPEKMVDACGDIRAFYTSVLAVQGCGSITSPASQNLGLSSSYLSIVFRPASEPYDE